MHLVPGGSRAAQPEALLHYGDEFLASRFTLGVYALSGKGDDLGDGPTAPQDNKTLTIFNFRHATGEVLIGFAK
jgi:hypothetical protein